MATAFPPALSSVVFLLFLGSGTAALIYEIVWQQLLQLVIGSSTVSLGVLLGVFMGGLCAGSLAAPRVLPSRVHPLRAFAAIEVAIAACGLLLLAVMPLVERAYIGIGGQGVSGVIARTLVAGICLLPPTVLMGATLPVVARWVEATPEGMSRLGMFYAGNLAGAVIGCLLAGFYLLRVWDMNVATYAAAAFNLSVASTAWWLSARYQATAAPGVNLEPGTWNRERTRNPEPATGNRMRLNANAAVACLFVSGFCALSAEVIWTRLLTLVFGATVYVFALVLAVFLLALGIGSSLGAMAARRVRQPGAALALCQFGAAAGMAYSGWMLLGVLPFWKTDPAVTSDIWAVFATDAWRTALAIVPAPVFWGASFPLALAAAADRRVDTAATVGRLYTSNTLGAILGALGTSLVLIAWFGTARAQQHLILLSLVIATATLWFVRRGHPYMSVRWLIPMVLGGVILQAVVPPLPAVLVGYGRNAANWVDYPGEMLFVGEGRHATVAVSRTPEGVLNYHNAGKVQASSQPPDMRLQRMLGHLTTIVPRRARKVLVIGCGAGVTAGAVSISPMVESVTIVDIEPLVPQVAREFFGSVNHDVLNNPKVRVIADDARHFLMTTDETFDAITSDPLDPWVKGAATLYTREFFETARAHLNPGGVMTLFVQLYESSYESVQSEVATFFDAFPHGLVFGNTFEGQAIDTVLVGQAEPFELYLDDIDEALRTPAFRPVMDSLSQIGFGGSTDLFGNYAGRAHDLKPWLEGAQINRDRNLRLQYLAGLGVNFHEGNSIYGDILHYRKFPDGLFIASESTIWRLQQALEGVRE
jgi:spermidine synthase